MLSILFKLNSRARIQIQIHLKIILSISIASQPSLGVSIIIVFN